MTTSRKSAEFLADLEEDATPFAAAPRFVAGAREGGGNQALAMSSIERAVLEVLLATGYEVSLAQRMAREIAASVPEVQEKAQRSV
jgi:hypothetical protein